MLKYLLIWAFLIGIAFCTESKTGGESSSGSHESSGGGESSSSSTTTTTKKPSTTSSTTTTTTTSTTSSTKASSTTTTASTTTKSVSHNSAYTSNYYYASFGTVKFPYAIGQCSAVDVSSDYMMINCVGTTHVNVLSYSIGGCTGTPDTNMTYNSTQATFYCGGTNTYAQVTIGPESCVDAIFTIYAALDVCVYTGAAFISVYCASSPAIAQLQYYETSTCTDASIASIISANSTCEYLFPLSGVSIYGNAGTCNTGTTTTTSTSSTTSSTASTTKTSAGNSYNMGSILFFMTILIGFAFLN